MKHMPGSEVIKYKFEKLLHAFHSDSGASFAGWLVSGDGLTRVLDSDVSALSSLWTLPSVEKMSCLMK